MSKLTAKVTPTAVTSAATKSASQSPTLAQAAAPGHVPKPAATAAEIAALLPVLRAAQAGWAARSVRQRVKILRRARWRLLRQGRAFATLLAAPGYKDVPTAFFAEVLPLFSALGFLTANAGSLLAPKKLGWHGRPLWLFGQYAEVHREALGTVLIIAPFNYPLFLPGTQAVQALAAGNAVAIKPSPGHAPVLQALQRLLTEAGLPEHLFTLLSDDDAAGASAVRAVDARGHGFDKICLTGSHATGVKIQKALADAGRIVPVNMELSGHDICLLLPDANLNLAAKKLQFALQLNAGASCIAPRRVLVPEHLAEALIERLQKRPGWLETLPIAPAQHALLSQRIARAQKLGARVVALSPGAAQSRHDWDGGAQPSAQKNAPKHPVEDQTRHPALLVCQPGSTSDLWTRDHFGPVLLLHTYTSEDELMQLAHASPYHLGASIFSRNLKNVTRFTAALPAQNVCINDLIVPTADPRLPFGGSHASGFGVSRGPEGLLEMTRLRVITL